MKVFFMNPWIIAIISGLFVGLLINSFIRKFGTSGKHKLKIDKKGSVKANNLTIGNETKIESFKNTKSHEVEIGKEVQVDLKGDFTVGDKN